MARPSPALTCITMVQVLCSISIIAITSNRMTHPGFGTDKRCYLSSDPYNTSPCSFAYVAAGISIATAVLAGCLRCCSLDCCGLGPIQSVILAAANCIWWLVASAILTAASVTADNAGLPAADARHLILAAAWCAAVSELVHSLTACLVVGNNVCNILFCVGDIPGGQDFCDECCGGCCAGCCARCCRSRRQRRRPATHQPLLPAPTAAAAAAVATTAWLNRSWWHRQPQLLGAPGPVTVVTVQQPAGAAGSASYMPPPPTAGQPYIVPGAASTAAWTPAAGGTPSIGMPAALTGVQHPTAGPASSFGGFGVPASAGTAGAGAGTTPALGYGLAQGVGQHPSAPAAPQQQQVRAYAPPVVMQQMDAGADMYPSIPKQ